LIILGAIASSLIKSISDFFNRVTSGSLGTADSGTAWTALRGIWYADGTSAKSDTAASSYPIAYIPLNQNVFVGADVTPGTGIAFWVTDSGSWWSATSYNNTSSSSYNCNPYSCNCYSCNPHTETTTTYYNCNPYNCNPYSCNCSTTTTCPSGYTLNGSAYFPGYCAKGPYSGGYPSAIAEPTTTTNCQTCYQTCYQTCSSTSSSTVYDTCCNTCYQTCTGTSYNYYLRLLKSVSGTVSSATSDISLGQEAAAIELTTYDDSISARAYSNTARNIQIGNTLSYTATSPVKGIGTGLIKIPSDYTQGSTIDNFSATVSQGI
jgi:hypothetical protein